MALTSMGQEDQGNGGREVFGQAGEQGEAVGLSSRDEEEYETQSRADSLSGVRRLKTWGQQRRGSDKDKGKAKSVRKAKPDTVLKSLVPE